MDNLQLLRSYQHLLTLSQTILDLAINGEWDALVAQEIVYVQSVENLSKTPIPTNLDGVMQLHFRQVLQQVLDNEAQIKQLLQKRMDELSSLMGQSLKQKSLNAKYSGLAGHQVLPGELLSDESKQ
ncbi:flagella biosynthesis regulatory protein FliT [Brenneria rubrifaciens]|uniref:Flagellar protein FliT n=1 Tax=Brenneria rubrifaciens TaxID=55213 RepID=A0A4V1F9P2_9GAMM|nr:flagella biosynthesis regulatory protein FliT [Brenneria rubrifaciens]QCR08263.1 flagella biosynthesis regulatory protein FliT [Brenneria rubrifaciens]